MGRRSTVVVGLIVAAAAALVLAGPLTGVQLVKSEDTEGCRTSRPDSDDGRRPLWIVLVGRNGSDADDSDAHLAHLTDVVLPAAADVSARVLVGLIEDDSDRAPAIVADARLAARGPAADNPEVAQRQRAGAARAIANCVTRALGQPPASRSDPFGAVVWAASVFDTTPASSRHLTLLSDAIATTADGCNLTGRDLRPEARPRLLRDCVTGDVAGLRGATVWMAGPGRGRAAEESAASTATPDDVIGLWRALFDSVGAELTRAGVTLLPASASPSVK